MSENRIEENICSISKEFTSGREVVLKVNSQPLGAVFNVVLTTEKEFYKVLEFLSDKPVYYGEKTRYKIKLKMLAGSSSSLLTAESCFDSIELLSENGSGVRYENCVVSEADTEVNADEKIVINLIAFAETRKFI